MKTTVGQRAYFYGPSVLRQKMAAPTITCTQTGRALAFFVSLVLAIRYCIFNSLISLTAWLVKLALGGND